MTCVVGMLSDGVVYMGADSAGVNSRFDRTVRKDSKVFFNGDFLIGCTSSFRMIQLLRYKLNLPKYRPEEKDLFEYMVTDFIEEVRKCLKNGGYATNDKGEESGGNFLVGINGRLFEIYSDYQVSESEFHCSAVGCGYAYALGAFHAADSCVTNKSPDELITIALQAATKFSAGVCEPFTILHTKKPKPDAECNNTSVLSLVAAPGLSLMVSPYEGT